MAKTTPCHRNRQHRPSFRDDARSDRTCERVSGRGRANRRFHGCRRIRGQGRRGRTVPGFDTIRPNRPAPGCSCAWRLGCRPTSDCAVDDPAGHVSAKRHRVRGTRARTRHAAGLGRSGAIDAGRGRGVEHAGPKPRRRSASGCAHFADRRHRARVNRAGKDSQHLPDHRRPTAVGIQRTADNQFDRDRRDAPTAPGRLSDRQSSGCCQRSDARMRSRLWRSCCGSLRR